MRRLLSASQDSATERAFGDVNREPKVRRGRKVKRRKASRFETATCRTAKAPGAWKSPPRPRRGPGNSHGNAHGEAGTLIGTSSPGKDKSV